MTGHDAVIAGGGLAGLSLAAQLAVSRGLVVGAYRRRFEVEAAAGATVVCTVKGRSMVPACGDAVEYAPPIAGFHA